jgi:hypothetical protein
VPRRQLDGGVSPAADRRGCCSPRRRLPGGASSRHLAVRHRRPGRHCQDANHGVGRRAVSSIGCPPIWCRCPGSGGPAVRYPARPVSGHLSSSPGVRRSGRLLSTRPVSSPLVSTRPASSRLVSAPSVRCVRLLPYRAAALGPGRCGGVPVTTGTGRVPVGCRAVERFGRRPSRPGRERCCRLACWSAGRRWRTRAPIGYGGDHARPACGAPVAGGGARAQGEAAARGGRTCRVAAVGAWMATTVSGGREACRPGGRARRADGRAGGDGRAAPARPRVAASAPGSLAAAL